MTCPISGKPCYKYKFFHVTEKKDEKINSHMVCEDCLYADTVSKIRLSDGDASCESCGIKLDDILKGSKIGCSNCYEAFKDTMTSVIRIAQGGSDRHFGTIPQTWKIQEAEKTDPLKFLLELKQKLAIALKDEFYEKANFLNSKIKQIEKIIDKNKKRAPSKELVDVILECKESQFF